MKIVINTCFGGFGLSEKAFEMLLNRKGIPFEKQDSTYSLMGPEYYQPGHLGDSDYFISEYSYYKNRADVDLVAVVEELQKDANNWASQLKVVEVPDDVEWHISEYDGLEHVAEDHRTWE